MFLYSNAFKALGAFTVQGLDSKCQSFNFLLLVDRSEKAILELNHFHLITLDKAQKESAEEFIKIAFKARAVHVSYSWHRMELRLGSPCKHYLRSLWISL